VSSHRASGGLVLSYGTSGQNLIVRIAQPAPRRPTPPPATQCPSPRPPAGRWGCARRGGRCIHDAVAAVKGAPFCKGAVSSNFAVPPTRCHVPARPWRGCAGCSLPDARSSRGRVPSRASRSPTTGGPLRVHAKSAGTACHHAHPAA
jgi:hypothetical protein